MYTNTLIRCVSNPVRFLKREISLHVRRVIVRPMARVEGMRIYIGGCVGGQEVFEQFVLVATLPQNTALLRTHHFPRPQVNDSFVGSILKKDYCCLETRGSQIEYRGASSRPLGGRGRNG